MEKLLHYITQRPGRVLTSFGVVMVVAMLLTGLLHFEQNILALLPQDNRSFKLLSHTVTATNGQDKLYVLVRGVKDDELLKAGKSLVRDLEGLTIKQEPAFSKVTMLKAEAVSADDFLALLTTYLEKPSLFLTEEELGELSRLLHSPQQLDKEVRRSLSLLATPSAPMLTKVVSIDPLNLRRFLIDKIHALQGGMAFSDGNAMLSRDGKALILIASPGHAGSDTAFAHELIAAAHELFASYPHLSIGLTGGYAIAAQEEALMRGDILNCLLGSVLGIGLLFLLAYRRLSVLLFIIIPLAVGLQLALGVMAVSLGRVHMIAVAFAAVVLGLGVDFAIHVYDRYASERLAGLSPARATRRAVCNTGSAVLVGGLTSLTAFAVLTSTASPVLRQIGWLVSLGLLFCLITILWALPAWLNWLEGHGRVHAPKPFSSLGMQRVSRFVKTRPLLCLLLSAVVLLACLPGLDRLHFERDLEALHPEGLEAVQVRSHIQEHFGSGTIPMLVSWQSSTEEEFFRQSRRIDKMLAAAPATQISSFTSLTTLSDGKKLYLDHFDHTLLDQALAAYGLERASFPALNSFLAALTDQEAEPGSFLADLHPLHQRFFFRDDQGIIGVTWVNLPSHAAVAQLDSRMARLDPAILVVSLERAMANLMDSAKSGLLRTVILATILVMAILLIFFGSLSKTLLVLLPTGLALLTTAGLMGYLGISINLINFIIIPILIGIGLDDGIHIMDRFRENNDIGITLNSTGRSILLTTLTTCLGFGSLALARYQVLSAMGLLTITGVLSCFLYSVFTLSAILHLRGKHG